MLGLTVRPNVTCNIFPILDIDDINSYFYFHENYLRIQEYLNPQRNIY